MKWKTFVIGWVLMLAILLMAQRRSAPLEHGSFKNIVDLTHSPTEPSSLDAHARFLSTTARNKNSFNVQTRGSDERLETHLDAPAQTVPGMWTVDQIPAERLVRPLVVIDVSNEAQRQPDYRVSVEDVARYEQQYGEIPSAAVVMVYTGWSVRWNSARDYRNVDGVGTSHFPSYSLDAVRFLVEARQVVGLGIDTQSVDNSDSTEHPVHRYCAEHSVYHLENVANLMQAPPGGAIAVVTPQKIKNASGAPARILALVQ